MWKLRGLDSQERADLLAVQNEEQKQESKAQEEQERTTIKSPLKISRSQKRKIKLITFIDR